MILPGPEALLARGEARGVEAELSVEGDAVRVALTAARRAGRLGVDFGDEPTFLLLPDTLTAGVIEARVRARLLPDAPDYARGFIGLAFHVTDAQFEAVYLRPMNGLGLAPPPPRDRRGVQYFAWPDWKFDRLREVAPDRYEAPAAIAPDRWHHLRVTIAPQGIRAAIDGIAVLNLEPPLVAPQNGRIGLWVDIGTEGFFKDVAIATG